MAEHPLTALGKIDPAIMQHLKEIDGLIYADGALPRKLKLLIAMAFNAAHGAANGVRALASASEIAESLRVAYHLAGVGALYVASQGLKDLVYQHRPVSVRQPTCVIPGQLLNRGILYSRPSEWIFGRRYNACPRNSPRAVEYFAGRPPRSHHRIKCLYYFTVAALPGALASAAALVC